MPNSASSRPSIPLNPGVFVSVASAGNYPYILRYSLALRTHHGGQLSCILDQRSLNMAKSFPPFISMISCVLLPALWREDSGATNTQGRTSMGLLLAKRGGMDVVSI